MTIIDNGDGSTTIIGGPDVVVAKVASMARTASAKGRKHLAAQLEHAAQQNRGFVESGVLHADAVLSVRVPSLGLTRQ